jgi:hypothetical protein
MDAVTVKRLMEALATAPQDALVAVDCDDAIFRFVIDPSEDGGSLVESSNQVAFLCSMEAINTYEKDLLRQASERIEEERQCSETSSSNG